LSDGFSSALFIVQRFTGLRLSGTAHLLWHQRREDLPNAPVHRQQLRLRPGLLQRRRSRSFHVPDRLLSDGLNSGLFIGLRLSGTANVYDHGRSVWVLPNAPVHRRQLRLRPSLLHRRTFWRGLRPVPDGNELPQGGLHAL